MSQTDLIRFIFFFGGFVTFLAAGVFFSFRKNSSPRRWIHNVSLSVLNVILIKFVFPITLVVFASENQFGLLHGAGLPVLVEIAMAVVVLDFIIYWQHRVFHIVPFLWRLHRVHHFDTEFDTTTALRFHPIEIVISQMIKFASVFLLGLNPNGVLVFEIILNFSAMFNHANIRLPEFIEVWLKRVIVTPDFHRIHHSRVELETNSNFGFFLSIWDHIFGSSLSNSTVDLGLQDSIGLDEYRSRKEESVLRLLLNPFFS